MSGRSPLLLALSVVFAATLSAHAFAKATAGKQDPPQQQPPTFRSGTQVVEIDVRVFDKDGRFVTGLTRDDFEIVEDGKPQQVSTFFYVDDPGTAPVPPPTETAAPLARRSLSEGGRPRQTWIFFFDLNHLTPGGGFDRAKKAVEDFIRDRFVEGDVAGIVAGEKMVNNRLTSVRAELLDGLKEITPRRETRNRSIEMAREWPRFLDEEELIRTARNEMDVVRRVVQRACSDDPTACQMAEPVVRAKAIRLQQDVHRFTLLTLQAISGLAKGLARIPGPKTIVLLSDGFVVQDIEATVRNVVGEAARSGARIYAIDVRGLNRSPGAANLEQLQADDPYGAVTKFDSMADAPNSLAIDTGGLMIRNENNIGRALETIAADSNRYYVLGFSPSNTNWDGKYRSLQVRVKRDGVRVRARKGYLAIEPARMTIPQPIKPPGRP